MPGKSHQLRATALAFATLALSAMAPIVAQAGDPHDDAIALARHGEHARALAALEQLAAARPDDRRIGYDQVVVLGWAGRDAEALARASGMDLAGAPAYVLEGIGRSARNLRRYGLAESVYRRSLGAHPQRLESLVGLALTLSDQGQHAAAAKLLDEALASATQDPGRNSDRIAALLAARGTAAESAEDWIAALSFHQRSLQADPQRRDALLGMIRTSKRLGAPQVAAGVALHHPGLLSDAEAAVLADEAAAVQIRWGRVQERIESGDARFAWLDQALARSEPVAAQLAEALRREPAGAAAGFDSAARRLLADRIVALNLRRRPEDTVALYQSMREAGLPVPTYALGPAADAMLATRQPEFAASTYREVLRERPDDIDASFGLFFALVEGERIDEALAHADALAGRTPKWRSQGRANPDAVTAETTQALARLYGDRLADAERRARELLAAYPHDSGVREAFGSTAQARGWPRLADEEFRRALAVDPDNAGLRAERVAPLLDVHAWAEAQAQVDDSMRRRPDDARVKRAHDLWTVHQLRELEVTAGFGRSSGAAPTGTDDWRLDARFYTQPLAYRWRVFAQTSVAQADFAGGTARWHREGLGAEYRTRDLRLAAALTGGSSGRAGVEANAGWQIDDQWSLEMAASSVSSNLPMQAWNAGVRAREAAVTGRYALNESRHFAAGVGQLRFSDGNDRLGYWASWFERWASTPRWRLETTAWLGASSNSLDGAPYFNPASDLTATIEVAGEWLTWRRYDRSFRQRLAATLGAYDQQGFGSGPVVGWTYEHIWELDRRLSVRYGIGRLLRPYDGARSGRSFGSITLNGRF